MKMKMRAMELHELQEIYTKPAVRKEGNGYYLRKVGWAGRQVNPNLQIHVPCMGLPIEGDEPIDLMRGFLQMPKLREVMNLDPDHKAGFLFCKEFYTIHESNIGKAVCHINICDPSDAKYVLIITAFADETELFKHNDPILVYGEDWSGYAHKRGKPDGYVNRYSYSLVPIGFRDVPEGEEQSVEDMERVKTEVIRLANEYLGIEDEGNSEMPENKTDEAPNTQPEDTAFADFIPPGLAPSKEGVRFWTYCDDISAEDGWVIDKYGRLLNPTSTKDCRDNFLGPVKLAELRVWENLPDSALAISWSKPSISEPHEFNVAIEPICTTAQLERVALLEAEIEERYAECCSPYDGAKSPSIGKGWNLWDHGVNE